MYKLAITGALVAVASAHPVNQSIVDEIKAKTNAWTPMDPTTNPMANKSESEIKGLLGTIRTAPMGY
jgi:hypothetical protein